MLSRTQCWTHPCAVLLQCLEVEKQTVITENEELLSSSHAMIRIANMTCSGLTLQLWDFLPHAFKGSAVTYVPSLSRPRLHSSFGAIGLQPPERNLHSEKASGATIRMTLSLPFLSSLRGSVKFDDVFCADARKCPVEFHGQNQEAAVTSNNEK